MGRVVYEHGEPMGKVIYDATAEPRRDGERELEHDPQTERIRAEVHETIARQRVRLAEARGRALERARILRQTCWGIGMALGLGVAFVFGWAFARMMP